MSIRYSAVSSESSNSIRRRTASTSPGSGYPPTNAVINSHTRVVGVVRDDRSDQPVEQFAGVDLRRAGSPGPILQRSSMVAALRSRAASARRAASSTPPASPRPLTGPPPGFRGARCAAVRSPARTPCHASPPAHRSPHRRGGAADRVQRRPPRCRQPLSLPRLSMPGHARPSPLSKPRPVVPAPLRVRRGTRPARPPTCRMPAHGRHARRPLRPIAAANRLRSADATDSCRARSWVR